jgi:DNA-directed RNA polymerase subunit RPC12/RpoP
MSIINLKEAKVSYEGQTLPAVDLIGKLQAQLQETSSRMAAIAATLGQLQTALLNSHTVEVKLTLSKEDYDRFRVLGGVDDSDRIRKALMTVIHSDEIEISPVYVQSRLAVDAADPPTLSPSLEPEPQAVVRELMEQPVDSEMGAKKKASTKCPRCQSQIDLPEFSNDKWPVEVKCANCGAKCLIKSKTVAKTDKTGFEPLDDAAYGKLFDMLST